MQRRKTLYLNQYPHRPKNLLLLSALLFFVHISQAQVSFIQGIVNRYYQVVEVLPVKACIRVTNPTGLAHNDRVMLIQMKGASINTGTGSNFGDTTSLNDAGNYELGTVCDVRGDSVFLVYLLLNSYDVTGKVQLVRIPQYYSATVTDTLKAASWNNVTGTGAVLAISVQEDLTLNERIYADSTGFRGGSYRGSGTGCSNSPGANLYAYNGAAAPTQDGAYKGEGVVDLAAGLTGGRGAPANGGGGGNNHNNGGAGGANLNAGGKGGGNSSSTGCFRSYPGEGGKALSNYGGIKIFLGGGGGAGHVNNGTAASKGGGHGGGIIFIDTKNLLGNGYSISANGQMGNPAASDGASGGGAGGTILLKASNYIGVTNISANGGTGGTEDDGININRCYGSGGGGSGGAIYFSGAAPAVPITMNAGNAGLEFNRDVGCTAMVPSAAGSAGQQFTNYSFIESKVLVNGYCAKLLPVALVSFNARFIAQRVALDWRVGDARNSNFIVERYSGGRWEPVTQQPGIENKYDYQAIDPTPPQGLILYRLRIESTGEATVFSNIQKIYVPGKSGSISIYPNPASSELIIGGDLSHLKEIQLFDIAGRMVMKQSIAGSQGNRIIDLPKLSPGVYMLRMGMQMERVVIK